VSSAFNLFCNLSLFIEFAAAKEEEELLLCLSLSPLSLSLSLSPRSLLLIVLLLLIALVLLLLMKLLDFIPTSPRSHVPRKDQGLSVQGKVRVTSFSFPFLFFSFRI
jgi:flagellar biogenesis protein FliO